MIQIDHVSYTYKNENSMKRNVGKGSVENIKLHVNKGECVVLCGKSGCGKTTVLRMINGLVPHFYEGKLHGNIVIAGMDVKENTLQQISKYVGSVFQNPRSQFFHMDTTGEIAFNLENQGVSQKEMQDRVQNTIQALNLQNLIDRNIFELSGGEKQRVAMATALCAKRKIMLYDEPTSGQDGENLYRTIDTIKKLNEHAMVSFVMTHDPEFILRCATHILHIHEGEVKECKPMDEDGASYMWKILKERNKTMKQNKDGISRLLEFTGKYRGLLGVSQILSGISAIFILMPFICVYYAARELINTFVGNDLNTQRLMQWGIYALVCEFMGIGIYFCSLMCSHIVAFHTEKNLKMAALMHLSKMPL